MIDHDTSWYIVICTKTFERGNLWIAWSKTLGSVLASYLASTRNQTNQTNYTEYVGNLEKFPTYF